jgi:hypothetical protein
MLRVGTVSLSCLIATCRTWRALQFEYTRATPWTVTPGPCPGKHSVKTRNNAFGLWRRDKSGIANLKRVQKVNSYVTDLARRPTYTFLSSHFTFSSASARTHGAVLTSSRVSTYLTTFTPSRHASDSKASESDVLSFKHCLLVSIHDFTRQLRVTQPNILKILWSRIRFQKRH